MKRGLVLSGGGSRGAYEIGAWQALDELGVRFDGVYGTSIGALNAALFAQGDLAAAMTLWSNITVGQIMAVEDDDDFAIERMVSRKRDVIPFLMENARHLRMDISPLEALVRERLDEGRIRASGMRLGVMTCRAPQLTAMPALIDAMKPGSMGDWVIASASCFPIFPARHIDGQRYIDGGYCDNLPIDMALADGMDEIVTVELRPEPHHPEYARMPWLTSVRPLRELGGFLDFNPALMHRCRLMGYHDTMKRWGRLDGFAYTFRRVNDLAAAGTARRLMRRMTAFDGELTRRGAMRGGPAAGAPLLVALERDCDGRRLAWRDVWLRGVELCAEAMGFREDAVYDADSLLGRCRDFCAAQAFSEKFDDAGLTAVQKRGARALLAFLYRRLDSAGDFPPEMLRRLGECPGPVVGAMLLAESRE